MKKIFIFLLFLQLAFSSSATVFAQVTTSENIKKVTTTDGLPCSPSGKDIYVSRTTAPKGIYQCTATNTWTLVGGDSVPAANTTTAGKLKSSTNTSDIAVTKDDPTVTSKYYADSFGSMSAALSALGTTNNANLIVSTTKAITSNLTISDNVATEMSNAADFNVSSGQTLTINGSFTAPRRCVFKGAGSVNLTNAKIDFIYPEWFCVKAGDSSAGQQNINVTGGNKALAVANSRGGATILFDSSSRYYFNGELAMTNMNGIALTSDGKGSAELVYTAAGTGSFITIKSAQRITIENLLIDTSNAAYAGNTVRTDWANYSLPSDSAYLHFNDLTFTNSGGGANVVSNLSLNKSIIYSVQRCRFGGAKLGIIGANESMTTTASGTIGTDTLNFGSLVSESGYVYPLVVGQYINITISGTNYQFRVRQINSSTQVLLGTAANEAVPATLPATISGATTSFESTGHSNVASIRDNTFLGYGIAGVKNASESWLFDTNTTEPSTNGKTILYKQDNYLAYNLTFFNNWTGDGTVASTAIQAQATGLRFDSNRCEFTTASTCIEVSSSQAVVATSNRSNGISGAKGIVFTKGFSVGVDVTANDFSVPSQATNAISGNFVQYSLKSNVGVDDASDKAQTFYNSVIFGGATTIQRTNGGQFYATGATNGSLSANTNWIRAPKNGISAFIGDDDSTSGYAATDFSGAFRFNGTGVGWGDLAYFPTDTTLGKFRFSTTSGSALVTTPNVSVGVGSLVSQGIVSSGVTSGGGDVRSYQDASFWLALKTSGGKSGLFRSNTDYLLYYDTTTGETNLDATYATNPNLVFRTTGTERARLTPTVFKTTGDVYVTDTTKGIILKSPDGTCYRFTVANGGALSAGAAVTCP